MSFLKFDSELDRGLWLASRSVAVPRAGLPPGFAIITPPRISLQGLAMNYRPSDSCLFL